MRLSKLEIKGFKSFGDKVTIHFDQGVTAIVGPNGSGKSNVVDAMRWVLGEQKTRMLRSEKMENIIFNGTKTRKPAGLAEVSLSFENTRNVLPTEHATVTITRKLYRDGESEYFLNGVSCRLKDITDLFLDTGIGSDSYSIIELKMIDDIINDRNNTIKTLFEEAAGISKYKIRKKQTFQKLEETETDLNRVNDLLFEIEKNLKTLELQAKKTERYYKLKEQYKELSRELAVYSIARYKIEYKTLQQQEEQVNNSRLSHESQLSTAEAQLQSQKLATLEHEKHLSASQKALNEKMAVVRQRESDKKIKNERLKFLQDKEQTLTNQVFNDKKTINELSENLKQLDLNNEQEQRLLVTAELKLNEVKAIVNDLREKQQFAQNELAIKTKQTQQLQEEIYKQEKQLAIQQTQKEAIEKEINRIIAEKSAKDEEAEQLSEQLETIQTQKENREEIVEGIADKEIALNKELTVAENTVKVAKEQLISLNRRIDAKHNEYNLVKSLVDNLEGFPESIKYLKKKAQKQAPLLSDVIYCQPEYKVALENYLEPFMNYFVVADLVEAKECVNILTEASQGRANFFLLNSFEVPSNTASPENSCIEATTVVEVDEKYRLLISALLHNVHIVIDKQDDIATKPVSNITYLTQNGHLIRTKNTLSGGSVGLFEGKRIGRAKSLEIMAKDLQEMEKSREKQQEQISTVEQQHVFLKNELTKLLSGKTTAQSELNRTNTQYTTIKTRHEQILQQIQQLTTRLQEVQNQYNTTSINNTDWSVSIEQISELHIQKEELQEIINEQQSLHQQLSAELNENSQLFNQQNIQFLQLKNKLDTITREIGFKKGQNNTLSANMATNTNDLEKVKLQIVEIIEALPEGDDDIIAMYEEKENLEKAVVELETEYYKSRAEVDEIENRIREIRKQKENNEGILQAIKDKIAEIKLQLNSLKERLSVEFELKLEEILEHDVTPHTDEGSLREQVEKLKGQIANYGPINPLAVEAYNEIKERHTFINAQQEDLRKAKESLLQTINEIDTTAKEKFLESYTIIRENFVKVFRSLFSEEDKCDLILTDSNNPLESEINIIAQPKGKRPLSINQLSGGEKTLTATALLFSIYLLKPAPFCIFDEVDAPLDDTNIDKFNNIIQKFSEESQFIIITHNKRTMAFCDIIYGITMVEIGITQVVPVDMREVA